MDNPLFSIILPLYNSVQYLNKSVLSVINQSYKKWELILIDDGSTDNTQQEIIDNFGNDKRIKYFRQENHGLAYSRKVALSKCVGKYILFLDHDDFYDSRALEILFNQLVSDYDFIVYSYNFVDSNKALLGTKLMGDRVFTINNDKQRFDYFRQYFLPHSHGVEVWGRCFKREFIEKYNIQICTDTIYSDDFYFCFVSSFYANSIKVTNYCLINNTQTIGSLSRSGNDNNYAYDTFLLFNNINNFLKRLKISDNDYSFYLFSFLNYSYVRINYKRMKIFVSYIKNSESINFFNKLLKKGKKMFKRKDYLFLKAILGNRVILFLYFLRYLFY